MPTKAVTQAAADERSEVLNIVRNNPGIKTKDIAKALKVPNFQIVDRVNWLKHRGKLVSRRAKDGRTHIWYLPADAPKVD